MNRPDKPPRSSRLFLAACSLGLAGNIVFSGLGCQVIGGLDDLKLANGTAGGGNGSGGNGGAGGGSANSSSSSISSSSGAPIIVNVTCGNATCLIGAESSCCSDHYQMNGTPYEECVNGPAGADTCKTAAGTTGYESRIKCQLPTHCAQGTVCCGKLDNASGKDWYSSVSCAATCPWPDTIICDPMSPDNNCPIVNDNGTMRQTMCSVESLLPFGYFVCQ